MAKTKFPITKALQETVKGNPTLTEVYFDADGNHYFKKHKITLYVESAETPGVCAETKDVESLPGAKKTILKVKQGKEMRDMLVNTSYLPVADTMSRDEVLTAKAVSSQKTEKEKLDILMQAQEILRSEDGVTLLEALK